MILLIILNLILSLWIIPEYIGKKRKIGFGWSLAACLFLSPLIGIIITLASPEIKEESKENVNFTKKAEKSNPDINSERKKLNELKNSGILTNEEYEEKIERLSILKLDQRLKNNSDYKKLKSLLDKEILTEKEFKIKTNAIKEKLKTQKPAVSFKIRFIGEGHNKEIGEYFKMIAESNDGEISTKIYKSQENGKFYVFENENLISFDTKESCIIYLADNQKGKNTTHNSVYNE